MDQNDKEEIVNAVKDAVQEHVNGRIDKLNNRLDNHFDEVEPFLSGWRGMKVLTRAIKYVAGFIIAVAGAIAVLTQIK